jgi:glycosyltransferase involved in cell wall biosynthesis
MPLLTIAIPTFDRLDCVRLLIDRLLEEFSGIADWSSTIELIIVNNASTDGTREYLDELMKRVPCKVFHNAQNLGMDGNFIRCFEVASGKWFWLCSDDDLPMIGAVPLILEALRDSNCGMVYLPTRFQVGSLDGSQLRADTSQRLQIENAPSFAARVNGLFTFITCIIANREAFLADVPQPDLMRLRGSFFAFFEWELELLKRAKRFGYFDRPIMLARAENSRGYNFAQVFTQRFNDACDVKLADRPDLLKLIVDGMRYRHLPNLFYKTRIGRNGDFKFDSGEAMRDYVRTYGAGPFYLFVMVPVFVFPLALVKAALFLGRAWGKLWIEWSTRTVLR